MRTASALLSFAAGAWSTFFAFFWIVEFDKGDAWAGMGLLALVALPSFIGSLIGLALALSPNDVTISAPDRKFLIGAAIYAIGSSTVVGILGFVFLGRGGH